MINFEHHKKHRHKAHQIDLFCIDELITSAIKEDLANGDLTTQYCVDPYDIGTCSIYCKSNYMVLCGTDVIKKIFYQYDPSLEIKFYYSEAQQIKLDNNSIKKKLVTISGNISSILSVERVALNFFARMSAIATHTRNFCNKIKNTEAVILDTRKTTPGLKIIEKYSTRVGGARNHRFNLSDGILIKENHLKAINLKNSNNLLKSTLKTLKKNIPSTIKIQIEVSSIDQAKLAYDHGADLLLLDNMTTKELAKCVNVLKTKIPLEASGNITLTNVLQVAKSGVDYISTSDLYHPPRCDLSLLLEYN